MTFGLESDALVPPPPPTNGRTKTASKEKSKSTEQKKIGYERGLKPVEIVGTTDKEGKLVYLIKWFAFSFLIFNNNLINNLRLRLLNNKK